MTEYTNFVKSTAKGYDMEPHEVQRILDNSTSNDFYQNLESFIEERAKDGDGEREKDDK